jgi:hypothetical protein
MEDSRFPDNDMGAMPFAYCRNTMKKNEKRQDMKP